MVSLRGLTLSLLLAVNVWAAPAVDVDLELRQLTEDNFRASTARGLWLVEHYSPKCNRGHCRAFAPTWQRLAKRFQHLERLSGTYMAQVNCLAQGDLCNRNEIKYYPQLVLYSDGTALSSYTGDRSFEDLSRFIEQHSATYVQDHLKATETGSEQNSSASSHNQDGKVVETDGDGLVALKSAGPVLVDFYAPWCPHCKQLRPIYEELATELRGKMNIAAINCDAHPALCKEYGIKGFPTIRLFDGATSKDMTGARTLAKMKEFALKSVKTNAVTPIMAQDFDEILKSQDVFFLYLQNFDSALSDTANVKSALAPIASTHPLYTSSDPELYKQLHIANPPPTSSLLAFSAQDPYPVGSLAFPADRDAIDRFIAGHKLPTLVQLTTSNFNDLLKSQSHSVVVLGALHGGSDGEAEKKKLYEIARAWRRGGRRFSSPVQFVWAESGKWAGWLRSSFKVKRQDLPAIVIIDPSTYEYYDTTIEGNRVLFEGASVFSVLEGFYQHFLRPRPIETTFEWGSRSATMTLISLGHLGADNKFLAFLFVVGGVGLFIFLLQKCIPRDAREGHKDHHNRPRLD
ncbi:thioredoxin-like protein [Kockovaella imperatae]|uniref:Thioredoxin-like protein n=1 Tax=Kockovaella imperatae TaxID=4999 RepID=A0A1Y1UEH5_9TREE|nr:thioredoxin-like protein [Kockovaella imperatae]ORX36460.1 thioredoxin-like protein [Kockovaella imperatae]